MIYESAHALVQQVNLKKTVPDLVVVVEVDPSAQTFDGVPPFSRISHHNGSALRIVLFDPHVLDRIACRNAQSLVDFVLNGETVGIPAEAATDVVAFH